MKVAKVLVPVLERPTAPPEAGLNAGCVAVFLIAACVPVVGVKAGCTPVAGLNAAFVPVPGLGAAWLAVGGRGGALGRNASCAPVIGLSAGSVVAWARSRCPVTTLARRSREDVSPVDISSNGKRS